MNLEQIVATLREERRRIDKAINALESTNKNVHRVSGSGVGRRGPRVMSAEARRRISLAQKRRWAKFKKSAAKRQKGKGSATKSTT